MTVGCLLDDGAHITCEVYEPRRGKKQEGDQQSKRLQKQIKHEKKTMQCDVSPPRQQEVLVVKKKIHIVDHQKKIEEVKEQKNGV